MDGGEHTCLEGTVQSLIYQNPENGYSVIRVKTPVGVKTATGSFPGVAPGETLLLTGIYTTHPSYGEQFRCDAFERRPPSGADAIFKYLASGAIRGVGPAKARDIVDRFGDETLAVIEREPERLTAVRGISQRAALGIGDWFRRQAGLRRLIEFLAKFEIKPIIATRLYKSFGDWAPDAVRDNPYIIIGEQFGASFAEADKIAQELGFEDDCPERVCAAILFEMSHNLNNGHTFLPKEKLVAATGSLIGAPRESIEDALPALESEGEIAVETVAGVEACYLINMYEAERFVAERILGLAETAANGPEDLDGLITAIERAQGITYALMQRRAVELASRRRVTALTGGPGTGKTTAVRGILAAFDEMGLKTALCAPTGRAAKRLGELCARDAATIHRLLGSKMGETGALVFDHDAKNPLACDAVIVDETSMVDILLMSALLRAMKPETRLVLVGDADQLPSVGPGNVFSDIIRSEAVPVIALREIFRQAGESAIVKNAHRINSGEMPHIEGAEDFFFLKRYTPEKIAETVTELVSNRLPKNMGIDPSQIQVLAPSRKHSAGTVALNRVLRDAVNPESDAKKEKKSGEFLFRVGDKVMQIRNNYDIIWEDAIGQTGGAGVFNGDVGRITDIDYSAETLTVDFEDKLVTYLFEQLSELEPAFAMTVHKSQGSEYRAVILAVSPGAPRLLTRGVLYTAITRARELLIIVGDPAVLEQMVFNDKRQRRYSGLRYRLASV